MILMIILYAPFLYAVFYTTNQSVTAGRKKHSDYIFNVCFSIIFAIWGFIIMNDNVQGKIGGALLFSALGWAVSFVFSGLTRLIPKKGLVILAQIACLVLLSYFVIGSDYGSDTEVVSASCCICGDDANKYYGGDYWCTRHYYMAKASEGDLSP